MQSETRFTNSSAKETEITYGESFKSYAGKAVASLVIGAVAAGIGEAINQHQQKTQLLKKQEEERQLAEKQAIKIERKAKEMIMSSEVFVQFDAASIEIKQEMADKLLRMYLSYYTEEDARKMVALIKTKEENKLTLVYESLINNARKLILEEQAEEKKRLKEAEKERKRQEKEDELRMEEQRRKDKVSSRIFLVIVAILAFLYLILFQF